MTRFSRLTWPFAAAAVLLAAPAALADEGQPIPTGTTTTSAPASKGSTDITNDKFQTLDKGAAVETKDATELSLSAGALSSSGNAKLVAMTAAEKFRLRRGENQLKQQLAGNYAKAPDASGDLATTVQNVQGLVRYDRFLGDFTLFLSAMGRNDKFQGLDLRLQVDPGVGYYFINEKTQQFWAELGYDLLFDLRRKDSLDVKDDKGLVIDTLPKTRVLHSGRAFVGYEHALTDSSKLVLGVEFMQGLSDTSIWRLNSEAGLTAKLVGNLSLGFSFTERFESKPLPGKEKLDTTLAASLVYTLL